jgi:hypothetical protein
MGWSIMLESLSIALPNRWLDATDSHDTTERAVESQGCWRLIYLSLGVHQEEQQRARERGEGGVIPMHLPILDDNWKV